MRRRPKTTDSSFRHHGTPNIGSPPAPPLPAAAELGIRRGSYDRPGYGGSSPLPGRDVASAAADVRAVADAPACGAPLPDLVVGVVTAAGLAPYDAEGLDRFAGMARSSAASLRAAAEERAAKEA